MFLVRGSLKEKCIDGRLVQRACQTMERQLERIHAQNYGDGKEEMALYPRNLVQF